MFASRLGPVLPPSRAGFTPAARIAPRPGGGRTGTGPSRSRHPPFEEPGGSHRPPGSARFGAATRSRSSPARPPVLGAFLEPRSRFPLPLPGPVWGPELLRSTEMGPNCSPGTWSGASLELRSRDWVRPHPPPPPHPRLGTGPVRWLNPGHRDRAVAERAGFGAGISSPGFIFRLPCRSGEPDLEPRFPPASGPAAFRSQILAADCPP